MKVQTKKKTSAGWLFLIINLLITNLALAQTKTNYVIKGVVKDLRTNRPVASVNVKLENTVITTVTNNEGNYELKAKVNSGTYTLSFTFMGYAKKTESITLGQNHEVFVNTSIVEDFMGLNEIVVTGVTVAASKKTLGNAISSVNAKELENANATQIDQALAGKISGAHISQNSGNPAGGISVRLRGTSTVVGLSDPLYIMDGVILNNYSSELIDLGGYAQNRLVDINPNDIERIEVIKGAAAAAIYGSRASNGVVQIFTKRGVEGKPKFNFFTNIKTSDIRKTLEVNAYPYRFNNTNKDDLSVTEVKRYDYQKWIFRTGSGNETNVSVSGGHNSSQYFISGNYLYNQGIINKTDFTRGSFKINFDQQLAVWLKLSVGINYAISSSSEIPNGGLDEAYGALTGFIFGNNYINPEPDPVTGIYPSVSSIINRTNPLEAINRFKFKQKTGRFIGNFQLNATPIKGLNIKYILGYDNANQLATGFIPVGNTTPSYADGYSKRSDQTIYLINNDFNASYQTQIGNWLESGTGIGATAQSEKIMRTYLTATQLALIAETVNNGTLNAKTGEGRSDVNLMGAYIQQTFGIMEKIYFTGAFRYDISSVFGKESRGQFYPKVSGSYLISNENFWKNSQIAKVIPLFKLRASYGQSGNLTALGPYDKYTNYTSVNSAGLQSLVSPALLGNESIKPERQEEFEIGTDFSLLNDRFGVEFSYYKKNVKDLLFSVRIAPSTGYLSQYQNIGTLNNKGIELLVRGVPILRDKFRWNVIATFNKNKNVINNIPGGILMVAGSFGQVAALNGYPIGAFYSTYFARNPDGSLLLNSKGFPQIEKTGRKDGQPDGTTLKKVIGDPNPDWTGSLINEFQIGKNLSVRAQMDVSYGGNVFNFTRRIGDRDLYGGLKGYQSELKEEVKKGTSEALFFILENWIENGSYAKLREVSVSYNFRPSFLKTGSIKLTLAGRNLFSIDNYSGYDPEINTAGQSTSVRGFDFVEVPIPRQLIVGLNMNF